MTARIIKYSASEVDNFIKLWYNNYDTKKGDDVMFFIYLFFGIGVLTTLVLMLPSLVQVYVYIYTLFATLKEDRSNAIKERQQVLKNKHDKKMAKLTKKAEEVVEEVVEEKDEVVNEPEVEEVKEEEKVEVAPYNIDYPQGF